MSMRAALDATLGTWTHLEGPAHAAERELLTTMADAIDMVGEDPRASVAVINASRYMLDTLRKLAPPEQADADPFEEAMPQWYE
jgi:hypothetical protein